MFSEFLLVVATLGGLVYFNEYFPFAIQSKIDKCKLVVLKKSIDISVKSVKKAKQIKSDYIWKKRQTFYPFVKKVFDVAMRVDPIDAELNVSTGKESIHISEAFVTHKGCDYDVLDVMKNMWNKSDGIQTTFFLQKILSSYEIFVDNESEISLIVYYSGHSNKTKRTGFGSFSVQYCGLSNDTVVFPPYESSACAKTGLGSVRILSASTESGHDCTKSAKTSAGLKGSFYRELKIGTIQKNVVTIMENPTPVHSSPLVNVFTSKGIVLCNEKDFDEAIIVN
jgi:hypothetical protein